MNIITKILDVAERRMRMFGYNAVSYRDIASEIGVKSASLHYHFPKKEDLGQALVRRYADNFKDTVEPDDEDNPSMALNATAHAANRILAFVQVYRAALEEQKLICLCAILGAEAPSLPESINQELSKFFTQNTQWLETHYKTLDVANPSQKAKVTLSLLEGSMIISLVNDDMSVFYAAVHTITEFLSNT